MIHVFDSQGKHTMTYKNLKFQKIINIMQSFFYAACDANETTILLEDVEGHLLKEFKVN